MSKTLFNQNTFQSKNVTNSDDVTELKAVTFKATNAILTNITNDELQAASAGVSTNATAISTNATAITTKQPLISADNRLSATLIGDNGNVSNTEFGYLSTVTSNIQTQIDSKEPVIDSSNRLSATLIGDNGNVSNTEYGYLSTVSSNIQDQLNATATKTTDMSYDAGTTKTTFANNLHIAGALSTVNFTNLNDTVFTNTLKVGITTEQANAIVANTAKVGITTDQTNAIVANTENLDGLTHDRNNTTTLDNKLVISKNVTPQLILERPGGGGDVVMRLRGKRTASTTSRNAKIDFQNDDSGASPTVKNLFSIAGRVTNHTDNVGGMEIVNYVDGETATSALTMSKSGNFNIGGGTTFQDNYKLELGGKLNVLGSIYSRPQITTYNFDKDHVSNNLWGNGNYQDNLYDERTIGDAFSSQSSGTITFSSSGTYKIKVSGNLQSLSYNDRLAFAIYLARTSGVTTTEYFKNESYNFFSWLYSRNSSDGAHGNISFEDLLYITAADTIQVRNKLDINNTNFDETLAESNLNLYLNVNITKISSEDIYNP